MGKCRVKNRYLKKRGAKWHYWRRVPDDVAGQYGRRVVELSLRTKDVVVARQLRDQKDRDLEAQWNSIRNPVSPPTTVSDQAAAYQEFVAFMATEPDYGDGWIPADPYQEQWEDLRDRIGREQGITDEEEMERATAATPEGDRLLGLIMAAEGNAPIDVAGKAFLDGAKLAEETKRLYRGVYGVATGQLPAPPKVTRDAARRFLQGIAKERTAKTVSNYRTALRALWGHLGLETGLWSGFRIDSGKEAVERHIFTDEQLATLVSDASPKLIMAIAIAAHTGCRAIELAHMQYLEEVDHIHFPRSKTTAGVRTIPCPDAVRDLVKAWVEDPWKAGTISNRFNEHKERKGFARQVEVFHSLRHSALSQMHEAGVPEAMAALIAGHKHSQLSFGRYGNKVGVEALRPHVNTPKYPHMWEQIALQN